MTLEQNQEIVRHIESMKISLIQIDEEHLKQAVYGLSEVAGRYDTAAVLNRNWNEYHGKLLQKQLETLKTIQNLIELLKECDKLKIQESVYKKQWDEMSKMFG